MRIDILGVGFDDLTPDEAVTAALAHISARDGARVVTPNPEIVMLAREDPELLRALNSSDMVLCDGIGVVYGARILKTPLKGKVPGIDFASALMARLAEAGKSVYLFGAKPGVAETAAENLKNAHPGLVICGTRDGYFSDDGPIIDDINQKRPELLLVCLGAPKQELWMEKNAARLDVGLMAGLGGSLDVFAGVVQRAPEGWQKAGLEWLYRLCKEPKRLGRMMKLPLFLTAAMGEKLKRRQRPRS